MPADEAEVLSAALELDSRARARIGERLLASVENPSLADLSPAWAAEIHRRLDAYDSAKVSAITADVALAELKAKYGG